MRPKLLGTKIGMTRIHTEDGQLVPVTVVKAGPCTVLQVKTPEKDGYHALQIGYSDVRPHRSTLAQIGHAAKAGTGPKRHVGEIRLDGPAAHAAGDVLTVEEFAGGKVAYVDVVGTSKGKGFAGVMKRHGFGGQPASHGTERKHRSPGGIGSSAGRGIGRCVKKGKRMSGHMGDVRVTSNSLKLLGVDSENNLLLIHGSVPGANGSVVAVLQSKKRG